eukprot:scaffold271885_cov20-Tisochrysis_lutea.AAC.1
MELPIILQTWICLEGLGTVNLTDMARWRRAPRPSQRAKLLTLCSAQAKGRTPAADNALVTWSCKAMEACTSNQDAPIFSHSATPAALASSPFH